MRLVITISLALLAAACASAPPREASATTTGGAPAATAAGKSGAPAVVPVSKLTSDQLVALQMQGYKMVTTNGETLYCTTDLKTGSHLVHDNTCLTERQIVNLREETQRRLQTASTPVPPKQGT